VKHLKLTVVAILGLLLGAEMAFAQDPSLAPNLVEGVDYFESTGIEGVKKLNISGMQFLKIGQSARAEAMGGAFTAVSDDINAMYWNGAGLVHVENVAYQANYTRWLAGTELYSMAAVYNTHSSRGEVIGISVVSQQVDPIEETTIFQPDGTGNMIDVGQMSIGLLYALKFTDKFSFSAKLNYVQEVLYTTTTRTFTLDLGSYFYTGYKSLRVGMSFRNFGPDQKSQEANFSYLMPLTYNMAVAGEVYGEKGDPAYLTLAFESSFPIDYEQRYHLGGELWIQNMFAVRGGWKWNYDLESFGLGAGFKQTIGGRSFTADVSYSMLKKRDGVAIFDPPIRVSIGGTF